MLKCSRLIALAGIVTLTGVTPAIAEQIADISGRSGLGVT
jgi:hypothetical protein